MRIIGGKFKGKKLHYIKSNTTRPTRDMVREAVFNILGTRVRDAEVLDLFAGYGAYGLEALSRGAKSAIFNDHNPIMRGIIVNNLASLGLSAQVHGLDHSIMSDKLRGKCFDIIFLDPPYDVEPPDMREFLTENGVIVLERATGGKYRYGNTTIDIIQKTPTVITV